MSDSTNPIRLLTFIGLLALGLVIGIFIVAEVAEAAQPVVTIGLDQPTKEADVAPGKSGLVQFSGTVSASQIGPGQQVQQIRVNLDASAGGWPATISPESIVFDSPGTQPFSLSVKAPPRTSHRIAQEVIITGTAQELPGLATVTIPETKGAVYIQQFYKFSVECEKPYLQVQPGKQVMFSLKINNEGNDADTIKISVDNREELGEIGWTVQLSSQTREVLESESDSLTVQVTTPPRWTLYKNEVREVRVKFFSFYAQTNEGLAIEEVFPIFVRMKGTYIPGFEPMWVIFGIVGVGLFLKTRKSDQWKRH